MSVADTTSKPAQAKLRTVYNLDALSSVRAPNLGLQLASISTSVGPILSQVAGIVAAMDVIVKPIQEAMKAFHEMVQRIIEPVKEMMKAYTQSFRFLTTLKPIYYVQDPPVPAVTPERKADSPYLPATIDQYGFFVIDGEPLTRLHTRNSRTGKVLNLMMKRRSNLITYQEFDEAIKTGTFRKDFRDLKYQLKQQGIELDYTLVRTEGIALQGLTRLQ